MKPIADPRRLDVRRFAQGGQTHTDHTAVGDLPRLLASCEGWPLPDGARVEWVLAGQLRADASGAEHIWLHLQARAEVPLTCQLCLEPVLTELHVSRDFRFVADEDTALAEDDDSEEDLLVLERDFDVLHLLEDELLMALPLVPAHEVCPRPLAARQASDEAGERPHPFAALAGFKPGSSR